MDNTRFLHIRRYTLGQLTNTLNKLYTDTGCHFRVIYTGRSFFWYYAILDTMPEMVMTGEDEDTLPYLALSA